MTVLERAPMDAIAARAAEMHPGQALLKLLASLLFLLGWLPARLARGVFLSLRWCAAAVVVGASEGWSRSADEGS